MKKKEFFLLALFLASIVYYLVLTFSGVKRTEKLDVSLFEKSNSLLVSAVQQNNKDNEIRVYRLLNKFSLPVVLFNLTNSPVVWNDSALDYDGEYQIKYTVLYKGKAVGYLGVGKQGKISGKEKRDKAAFVLIAVLFFIAAFSNLFILHFAFLVISILYLFFTGDFSAASFFFTLFYLKFGKRLIPSFVNSLVFFVLSVSYLSLFFSNPVVFLDLFNGAKTGFSVNFIVAFILSSVFFVFINPREKLQMLFPLLGAFFGVHIFVFSCFLVLLGFFKSNSVSGGLLKIIVFSFFTVFFGFFYGRLWLSEKLAQSDFSYATLEKRGKERLERYIKLAESKGFANLKDFIKRSGLQDEDFSAVYFNVVGEVVESYSKNIPVFLKIPRNVSFYEIEVDGKNRRVISSSGAFKFGFVVINLAYDIYNSDLFKFRPYLLDFVSIKEGEKGYEISLKGVNLFDFSAFVGVILVLSILFFLVYFSSVSVKSLFDRVVYSVFLGFSSVFEVLALVLFFHSKTIVKRFVSSKLEKETKRIKKIVENDVSVLSDEYLKWLKSVFDADLSVYGKGVIQFSTDYLEFGLLMPFKPYWELKNSANGVVFYGDRVFTRIDFPSIPFAMLSLMEKKDNLLIGEIFKIASVIFFAIFMLSYLVSYVVSKTFVPPIVEISKRAMAVSKGDYSFDVKYEKQDEIKQLIDSIKFMTESIKRHYQNLKTIIDNVSSAIVLLDKDGKIVAENIRFEGLPETLKKIMLESEESGKVFSEGRHYQIVRKPVGRNLILIVAEDISEIIKASKFEVLTDIARKVAHDIKNPLTPIKLNIEYLLAVSKKKKGELEKVLPEVADVVFEKIDELKNISAHFSGLFKAAKDTKMESVGLKDFLEKLFSSYPSLEFSVKGDAVIYANKSKLSRIFENLIENALNFSDKPKVEVVIEDKDDLVKVIFTDNGEGIPEENLEKVFEPYFSTREDGTGLGLFIVKEFIEEMGGKVRATSSEKGGRFELEFRKEKSV